MSHVYIWKKGWEPRKLFKRLTPAASPDEPQVIELGDLVLHQGSGIP